jgi:hypothetical protein
MLKLDSLSSSLDWVQLAIENVLVQGWIQNPTVPPVPLLALSPSERFGFGNEGNCSILRISRTLHSMPLSATLPLVTCEVVASHFPFKFISDTSSIFKSPVPFTLGDCGGRVKTSDGRYRDFVVRWPFELEAVGT